MKGYQDAEVYLQVEPIWRGQHVVGAKVIALNQKKPSRPRGGTITTKITIRIPTGAFLPLQPEAVVVIPEGMVVQNPIEVEATDAN